MSKDMIEKQTKDLLMETLKVAPEYITPNTLLADLTADSIQLFEVVLAFEKSFNLRANYEDLIQIETVGDIIAYLSKQLPLKETVPGQKALP